MQMSSSYLNQDQLRFMLQNLSESNSEVNYATIKNDDFEQI